MSNKLSSAMYEEGREELRAAMYQLIGAAQAYRNAATEVMRTLAMGGMMLAAVGYHDTVVEWESFNVIYEAPAAWNDYFAAALAWAESGDTYNGEVIMAARDRMLEEARRVMA